MSPNSSSEDANPPASKRGHTQACASCKHQRRKCQPECKLAPYFPGDRPNTFRNAHRLFGVSKILRAINHSESSGLREPVMETILFHSNAREQDPVCGCIRIIMQLKTQIDFKLIEWKRAQEHLSFLESFINQQQRQEDRHPGAVNTNIATTTCHQTLVNLDASGGSYQAEMEQQPITFNPTNNDDPNHTFHPSYTSKQFHRENLQEHALQNGLNEDLTSVDMFGSLDNQSLINFDANQLLGAVNQENFGGERGNSYKQQEQQSNANDQPFV